MRQARLDNLEERRDVEIPRREQGIMAAPEQWAGPVFLI